MTTWVVRLRAEIDDEMEVEADSEEQAIENAHCDWSFVEGKNWSEEIVSRPEEES